MTLRSRCPHCQQTQPIEAGTNTQAALACRSCGQRYVPHRHLFVGTGHAAAEPVKNPGPLADVEVALPIKPATHSLARWWIASLVLALMLMIQITLAKRDLWSAQWPIARAPLHMLCALFNCQVQAPELLSAISLVSSGFDQQEDGTFELEIVLRHDLPHALATPAVELTLTDDFDRAIVRKIFLPASLGLATEMPAGASIQALKPLQLDPDLQPHVSGFRIELFYP